MANLIFPIIFTAGGMALTICLIRAFGFKITKDEKLSC